MDAKLVQGEPLMVDYTPTANAAAGSIVVVGHGCRIVHNDIEANRLGAIAAGYGVYDVPKSTSSAYANGVDIGWDADNGVGTTLAGQLPVLGKLVEAAAETAATMRVLHLPAGVSYLGS